MSGNIYEIIGRGIFSVLLFSLGYAASQVVKKKDVKEELIKFNKFALVLFVSYFLGALFFGFFAK